MSQKMNDNGAQYNAQPPEEQPQQTHARKPDQIAYSVRNEPDGKSYWNRVGASWSHKDGNGAEIILESIPVDGRITLRAQRDKAMQAYDDARAEQPSQQQSPARGHGPQR